MLPPKAVASLRFVNSKNLHEYITEESMLCCWGGKDDYKFRFSPEKDCLHNDHMYELSGMNESLTQKDENDNTDQFSKKVSECINLSN